MRPYRQELRFNITYGRLGLGTWKQISYDEFDGRHGKRVLVKIVGE